MSTSYGPEAATRAHAARASMRTAAVNADRAATATDREAAAEREMAAYESYWHAHGVPPTPRPAPVRRARSGEPTRGRRGPEPVK